MLWKRFLKNIFLEIMFNPNLLFLLKKKFWVKRFLGKNFTRLKNWFKECFDKSYFYLISKPCTNCFPHGFYFPKYSKFPFLNQTWISHYLFKKRRTVQLFFDHRFFAWAKRCELSKKKGKTESWVCDWDLPNLGILRT